MLSNKLFFFQETTNQNLYIYRLEITGCIYFRISMNNFSFFSEMKEIISRMWKMSVVFHGGSVLGCQCVLPNFSETQLNFLRLRENTKFATILS